MPVLHLIAGPHGSGKSTYVARVLQPAMHLPHAATDADLQGFLNGRRSFIAETTLDDDPKSALVDEASRRGYLVHLHVVMMPVELATGRVADRVRRGGHDVPEQTIRDRYAHLWPRIKQAKRRADITEILDNSQAAEPFRLVVTYTHGSPTSTPRWPHWTPSAMKENDLEL